MHAGDGGAVRSPVRTPPASPARPATPPGVAPQSGNPSGAGTESLANGGETPGAGESYSQAVSTAFLAGVSGLGSGYESFVTNGSAGQGNTPPYYNGSGTALVSEKPFKSFNEVMHEQLAAMGARGQIKDGMVFKNDVLHMGQSRVDNKQDFTKVADGVYMRNSNGTLYSLVPGTDYYQPVVLTKDGPRGASTGDLDKKISEAINQHTSAVAGLMKSMHDNDPESKDSDNFQKIADAIKTGADKGPDGITAALTELGKKYPPDDKSTSDGTSGAAPAAGEGAGSTERHAGSGEPPTTTPSTK